MYHFDVNMVTYCCLSHAVDAAKTTITQLIIPNYLGCNSQQLPDLLNFLNDIFVSHEKKN